MEIKGLSIGATFVLGTAAAIGIFGLCYILFSLFRSLMVNIIKLLQMLKGPAKHPKKTGESKKNLESTSKEAEECRTSRDGQEKPHMSFKQAKEAAKKSRGKPAKAAKHSHPLFLGSLQGHQGFVTGCAVSPDSKLIATSCDDRFIRIFSIEAAIRAPKCSAPPQTRRALPKDPVGVAFGRSGDEVVAATSGLLGHAGLSMYSGRSAEPAWEAPDCLDKKQALPGGFAVGYRGLGEAKAPEPLCVLAAGGGSTEVRVFSPSEGGRMLCKIDSGQMKVFCGPLAASHI